MEVFAIIVALFVALLAVERKTEPGESGEFTDTVDPLPIWSDYRSDGGLYLIRQGGERHFNTMWLHVCRTGELEQFYTLYQEVMWFNGYSCNHSVVYCGNLAHDKDKALEKAYERAWSTIKTGMWHDVRVDFHKSPRRVSNTYYAFSDEDGNNGIEMKLSKSGDWYWGSISGAAAKRFWGLWKADKKAITDAGFSVSKKNYEWLLYMKAEVMNVDYDSETAIYEPEGYIPRK